MKAHKKIIAGILFSLGSFSLHAQQVPMYTHYMYNTLSVNPAYAGSREALSNSPPPFAVGGLQRGPDDPNAHHALPCCK
jgi:hypothetical protein